MNELANTIKKYNHICWYPSAGADYRALLYLSDVFYDKYSESVAGIYPDHDRVVPDLFIYTDVNIPSDSQNYSGTHNIETCAALLNNPHNWKKAKILYRDKNTTIIIESISRFEGVITGLNKRYVNDDYGVSENYGNALLMNIKVESYKYPYGTSAWRTKLLYVIGENVVVAKNLFLDNSIKIDTVVQIRYGDGWGGAELKGQWVKSLFSHLDTKYFIANQRYIEYDEEIYTNDINMIKGYFEPYELVKCPAFAELYRTDGIKWSSYGPVCWCKVEY